MSALTEFSKRYLATPIEFVVMKKGCFTPSAILLCCLSLYGCDIEIPVDSDTPVFHINNSTFCRRQYSDHNETEEYFSAYRVGDIYRIDAAIVRIRPDYTQNNSFGEWWLNFQMPIDSVYEGSVLRNSVTLSCDRLFSEYLTSIPEQFADYSKLKVYQKIESVRVAFIKYKTTKESESMEMEFSFVANEYCAATPGNSDNEEREILLGSHECKDGFFRETY